MKKKIISIFLIILTFGACSSIKGKPKPEPFTASLQSPQIEIGVIEAQFDELLPGIKKYVLNVLYFPVEEAVCLQYKQDFYTHYQFWNREGRDLFAEAFNNYKTDYDTRNLPTTGGRKAKGKYGAFQSYLIWQMSVYQVQARASMNIELGYAFKEKNPYFCVNQKEAFYEDQFGRDNNKTKYETSIYFTRAQAEALLALFDQSFLDGLSLPGGVITNPQADFDEYNEN
jgi:hypothetical protein